MTGRSMPTLPEQEVVPGEHTGPLTSVLLPTGRTR